MRCRIVHAPARARGTHRPAFAGKSHQALEAALATLDSSETVFEQAASLVALDFAFDEIRQSACFFSAFDERGPVLRQHPVKRRMLRLATLISTGSERLRTQSGMGGDGHTRTVCTEQTEYSAVSSCTLTEHN